MQQLAEFESSGQPAGQDSMLFPGIAVPVAAERGQRGSSVAATDGGKRIGKERPGRGRGSSQRRRAPWSPRKAAPKASRLSLDVNAMTRVTQEATRICGHP